MKKLILLILLLPSLAIAQVGGPRLQWDMTTGTAAEVQAYQYELWIDGTGQLPLRTATCAGATGLVTCTDNVVIPSQLEGIRNFQLLAITPQGIKSLLSTTFQVTFPSAPRSLRFAS